MNRVYKVIWSKAKHCYVVTSEIAKSHTKGESTGRGLKKLAAALLVAAALMGPNFAWAADGTATVMDKGSKEQIVYTQEGADVKFATKDELNAKANAADVANTYVNKTDAQVTNLTASGNVSAGSFTNGAATMSNGSLNGINQINATGNIVTTSNMRAHDITAEGDIKGNAITGTSLNTQGGTISGGAITGTTITGTSLNTQNGEINGGDIKSGGIIIAKGKITGNGLDAGSGAVEGNSLKLKGGDLDAGSGTITTTGDINGNNINANGKITTTSLEVTGGLKTDHITLGSETNNYTDINKGNVTSEVDEKVSGVEYTAESIFNKDGSSITARADVGGPADSTGKSIVGAKEISQYLGDAALPDDSKKNVTRSMVRNGDTFYMEDKAEDKTVDGKNKYSTVRQNAGERTVTVTDGENTASTNLTAADIKNTAENGMISNTAKNLVNTASENMTNTVGGNLTTTVTGDSSRFAPLAEMFAGCGFPCEVCSQVQGMIWDKLMINASSSVLSGILQVAQGYVEQDSHAWTLAEKLIRELCAAATADGYPFDAEEQIARIRLHLQKAPDGFTSIYADLKAGRRTEVDVINGAVVEAGHCHNIPVPTHEFVVELVHAMEGRA